MQREITVAITDSIETVSSVESEIVRVVSFSTTEITKITRLFKKKKKNKLQGADTLSSLFTHNMGHILLLAFIILRASTI